MFINDILRGNTELMVGFLPLQLIKCLFTSIDALQIKVYSVEDIIIGNASLYDIVLLMRQTFATSSYIVKPFSIVGKKYFAVGVRNLVG